MITAELETLIIVIVLLLVIIFWVGVSYVIRFPIVSDYTFRSETYHFENKTIAKLVVKPSETIYDNV